MKVNQIIIKEMATTSGAVASVAKPMGETQKRPSVRGLTPAEKVLSGKAKKQGPYANSLSEGKMKDLAMDLKSGKDGLNDADFKKKYGKSKEEMRKSLQDKPKSDKPVQEAKLDEDDLILIPGQGGKRKTGFVPHGQSRVDHEVEMARSDVLATIKNAKAIYELLRDRSEDEGLEGWVQEKLIKANDYLNSVKEYYDEKNIHQEMSGGVIAGGGVGEGKFTVNARTGAKLDPRTGVELPPKEKPLTMKQMFAQPKQPKLTLDDVWRKVEDVVGQIFPDGDPIDYLAPWLEKHGIRDFKIGEILDRAAKKNGYKDLYDYYDSMKDQYDRDNVAEAGHQSPHAKLAQLKAKYDAALKSPNPNMTTLRRIRDQIIKLEFDLGLKEGVAEGSEKKDMTGQTCEKCKKDKYKERSWNDDRNGTLQCSCGHVVDRWRKYKKKDEKQGVAEGSEPQVGDEVYYGNRLVGTFKGYSKLGKIITEPNVDEMGDEYLNKDAYWDPKDITIKPKQGVAEGGILKSIKRGLQGWDKNAVGPGGEKLGDPRDIVKRAKAIDTDTAKKVRSGLDAASDHSPAGLQKRVLDRKLKGVTEGAKVDRMVKHIAKSERELGKSKDEAENIAWATANKRGYLDNKNKKKGK